MMSEPVDMSESCDADKSQFVRSPLLGRRPRGGANTMVTAGAIERAMVDRSG
jgi:hypothetical protein